MMCCMSQGASLCLLAWSVFIGKELPCVTRSTCCVSLLSHSFLQTCSVTGLSSQLRQAAVRLPEPAEQLQKLHMQFALCTLTACTPRAKGLSASHHNHRHVYGRIKQTPPHLFGPAHSSHLSKHMLPRCVSVSP